MAEYTNIAPQVVAANQNVLFAEAPVACIKGHVQHREGSGLFTLKGCTNQCSARYRVNFGGNISIPTGGTVGAISLAIAIDGEALPSATMIVTPAAVENLFNVFAAVYIVVPRGCCLTVSVQNTSDESINVQNANIIFERTA